MKAATMFSISSLILAMSASIPAATADSAEATCQLRKDGETKASASGPCTFSQQQGNIDIDLKNGDTVSLTLGDKANHYKDQKGKSVVRTVLPDGAHEYKWEGKKLLVTFETTGSATHGQQGHGKPQADSDTPANLRDLVGGRRVGGEVDDELVRRGYEHIKDDVNEPDVWSYWRRKGSSECVVVHLDAKRVVQSIAPGLASSCKP
jgi:hypothetical protein